MDIKIEDCVTPLETSSGAIYDYFQKNRETMPYYNYYHFYLSPLPQELIEEEPVLKKIHDQYPIEGMGISKFYPFTNHRWHMDTDRGLSVNMLLEHERSHVLFKYKDPERNPGLIGCERIHEVNYKPQRFYLFNTQIEHTISNFEGERYTFIMKFVQDKSEINYYDVLKYYESI